MRSCLIQMRAGMPKVHLNERQNCPTLISSDAASSLMTILQERFVSTCAASRRADRPPGVPAASFHASASRNPTMENDRRRNPARTQTILRAPSHETDVGRSSAIRCVEAAPIHKSAVNAAPRTGQLKSAAGVSRRARPRRECRAVLTFLAGPWLLERNVHTVGGQVESQPTGL
jgi:hypothetical protein